jgi:small subunit ribosomal protein S2e
VDPVTELSLLVKDMKIQSLGIYLSSWPITEAETTGFPLGASLKDEVLKILPVQKQTQAASGQVQGFCHYWGLQWSRNGLGVRCSKEVATAMEGPTSWPSFPLSLCRGRGYWGNKTGKPHTAPCKVTDRPLWLCAVASHPCPPKDTGIVSAPVP